MSIETPFWMARLDRALSEDGTPINPTRIVRAATNEVGRPVARVEMDDGMHVFMIATPGGGAVAYRSFSKSRIDAHIADNGESARLPKDPPLRPGARR